jgi:predicted DNA-binding transcriptional regulator YafY
MNDHDDLQVFRQRMILRTLGARRNGMTIRDPAPERGVDQQTSRRDLKTLKMLGFLLEETEGPRGRKVWRSPRNDGGAPLQFNFDEAVAPLPVRPFRKW